LAAYSATLGMFQDVAQLLGRPEREATQEISGVEGVDGYHLFSPHVQRIYLLAKVR
jgi:hypothetical protein